MSRFILDVRRGETPTTALDRHLDDAAPGDQIVYYSGCVLPNEFRKAGMYHYEGERCLLIQRPVPGSPEGARRFDYIAIKKRGKKRVRR